MSMQNDEQIAHCQAPGTGYYPAAIYDAEQRMKRGESQALCLRCERWQWPDGRCPISVCIESLPLEADYAALRARMLADKERS